MSAQERSDWTPAAPPPSLGAIASQVLRRRRLIVRLAVVLSVSVAILTLLAPRRYSVETVLLPFSSQGGASSRVAGLAAQFGIPIFGAGGGQSPEFYASLVESREMIDGVLQDSLRFSGRLGWFRRQHEHNGPLVDLLLDDGDRSDLEKLDLGARKLRELVGTSVDRLSSTVSIRVTTTAPGLSAAIADLYLARLAAFNTSQRQSQAASERRFVEQRLSEGQDSLRAAEARLERFLEDNRSFASAPGLAFAHDRLQRIVVQRQQLVTSLIQAFEQARIDEVRDTPVLTVVQPPRVPGLPNRRGLVMKTMVALFAGLTIGVLIAVAVGGRTLAGAEHSTFSFAEEWKQTRRELRRPWRLLW